jgi:hypothetical protein
LRVKLIQITLGAAFILLLLIGAQTSAQAPVKNPVHLPTDWSHRHMVFSGPANYSQAWQLQEQPRYFHQYMLQHLSSLMPASVRPNRGEAEQEQDEDNSRPRPARKKPRKDWAMSLGAGAFMGAGQFPAKFTFDISATPSCTADYVAFTTSVNGTLQIIAFDNLYATQGVVGGFCNADGPSVKWAYDTRIAGDASGKTLTSPVLSWDGTKVAYVESRTNANGGSILQILKWKPSAALTVQGSVGAPATPDTRLAAGQNWIANCPAANSCVSSIAFSGAQADTNSSPFYNYGTDELYVGDDNGVLHKFKGVFLGTPAEVIGGGWPLVVHTGGILTSPVFDFASGNIFLGDSLGRLSFVKEVGSTLGACGIGVPPCLGSVTQLLTGNIVDAPMVDGGTERVLVFDAETTNNGSVFQFDAQLSTASKVIAIVAAGNGNGVGSNLRAGAFDSTYLSSPSNLIAGHLYVCGKDPNADDQPAIYQLSFSSSGVLSTAVGPPLLGLVSNDIEECSPITEVANGATDRIFFSVQNNAAQAGCGTGGCVMSITLGGAWPPAVVTNAVPASGGTSGIVIDNVGTGVQQSNIYFTYQRNSTVAIKCNATTGVGCAVKLTQSALN